jgi:hypothetical protein
VVVGRGVVTTAVSGGGYVATGCPLQATSPAAPMDTSSKKFNKLAFIDSHSCSLITEYRILFTDTGSIAGESAGKRPLSQV